MATDHHRDWQFYFDGLRDGKLLYQKCTACKTPRFPPMPVCGDCQSADWEVHAAGGHGSVFSYVILRKSVVPDLISPIIAIVRLDEGIHIVSCLVDIAEADVAFDLPVRMSFRALKDGRNTHVFRPR